MKLILAISIVVFAATAGANDPKPDTKQLARDRIAAAEKAFDNAQKHFTQGLGTSDDLYRWSTRVLDAKLDGARGKAVAEALREHADHMHELDTLAQQRVRSGVASSLEADGASYYAIEADVWVARGKR